MAEAFDPNSETALFNTARLHYDRRELQQADQLCARILGGNPYHQKTLHLAGLIDLARGQVTRAKAWFSRAIAAGPSVEVLLDMADAHEQADDLAGARRCCQEALVLAPLDARAHCRLGMLLHWMGDSTAAVASLREAVRIDPDQHEARIGLGRALLGAGQYEAAHEALEPALGLKPPSVDALIFYGLACHELGEFSKAIEHLERAIKLERDPVDTLCNIANAHRDAGDFDRAAERYERALALDPNCMHARNDYSHALLARGLFERGWALYEARWEAYNRKDRELYPQPLWNGEALAGKRLLVWGEQGIGDQMMFASLLPELLPQPASCTVLVDAKLVPLFERSFPAARIAARRSEAHAALVKEPFDYQVPIASLGRHFRRSYADFPQHAGYLRADPAKVEAWKQRLAALGPGRKVAISWRGGFVGTRRHLRSIDLESWLPILKTPGVEFISLQYTDCAQELEALREKHGVVVHHWQEAIDDYDETAALVCAVDRVVSVCTALIHLAGAMGRPAWILVPAVPEWRYMREGERMPWYPAARLFRQDRIGEWQPVITRLAGALGEFSARGE
jgi:tetratricopeptide (TPR) repeat protein